MEKDKAVKFELYPVRQEKSRFTVKLLEKKDKDFVLDKVAKYSRIINDESLLLQSWNSFLTTTTKHYIESISPVNLCSNRYLKAVFNRLHINTIFLSRSYVKILLNFVRCEAHADLLKETLEKRLEKY